MPSILVTCAVQAARGDAGGGSASIFAVQYQRLVNPCRARRWARCWRWCGWCTEQRIIVDDFAFARKGRYSALVHAAGRGTWEIAKRRLA